MHYWNRDNFEGLTAIAEELSGDPRLAGMADYCRYRESGVRKQAFAAQDEFIALAASLPVSEKRELAGRIYGIALRVPEAHQFLSTPLQLRFLHPVLDKWLRDEPDSLEALRWDGIFRDNAESLARALALDPDDAHLRRLLIARDCLSPVGFAVHHIHESKLLGEVPEIEALLSKGEALLEAAPARDGLESTGEELAYYRRLMADWQAFTQSGAHSFPDWCAEKGRTYQWSATYYYGE